MKRTKSMASVILTVMFFFSAAAASANPLTVIKFGTKFVYELGRKAAGEAVEWALKRTGGKLPREVLEKIAQESFERTFREGSEKAIKEAFERGVVEAGEHLSREALEEAFDESMEQAARRVMNQVRREIAEETVEHTLGKQLVRGVIDLQGGGRLYVSGIVNGAVKFSSNPADAVFVPLELLKKVGTNMERNGWGLFVDTVSAF